MKKIIVVLAALAACVCASAQVKQYTTDLTGFASIDISNSFEVSLAKGETYSVAISVDEPYKDYVNCSVTSSTLYLGLDEKKVPAEVKKLYKGKGVTPPTFRAVISLPGTISTVTLHDKAVFFEGKDIFSADAIVLNVSDNCCVKTFDAQSQTVTINLDKNAAVNMTAFCQKLAASISGKASLKIDQNTASSDFTIQSSASLATSGQTENLLLIAKGSSKATLTGEAKCATYNISDSANINAAELAGDEAVVSMKSICKLTEAAASKLEVVLEGGATLVYGGDPATKIVSIKKSTMTRAE